MSGVRVAVRIRPLNQKEKGDGITKCCSTIKEGSRPSTNVVFRKQAKDKYLKSQSEMFNEYCFDAAFDENSTQKEVYEATTKPYLTNLIEGLNVTVFAYGATGAGKTHTMMGNARCDEATANGDAGIIPTPFSICLH